MVLIDKDYGLEQMKNICHYVERLFFILDRKHITADIGTSYNEVIGLADLIAGACKKNRSRCSKELRIEEIEKKNECVPSFPLGDLSLTGRRPSRSDARLK